MSDGAATRLKIAIIGHTNAGKTSLMRTLVRDPGFGEVSIHPATTRHAESVTLEPGHGLEIELIDTPGFEDPVALIDILHRQQPDPRMTGPVRLNHFLNTEPARNEFVQEAKAIRQFMKCDLLLYVADACEPVSARYQDEFLLLNWSGKPCLAVLNFTARANAADTWRSGLASAGLHNVVEFDTVVFNPLDEDRLLQQIAVLVPRSEQHIQCLRDTRKLERRQQIENAAVLIAGTLVEAAGLYAGGGNANQDIMDRTRLLETRLNRDLLKMFRFTEQDYAPDDLPINGSQWRIDLFDPQVLSSLGLSLGSSAAKGAAAGATIDLLTGFTSLGTATLVGGLVGSGLDAANRLKQYMSREQGEDQATEVSIESLCFLARRACLLVQDLSRRGHAAVVPMSLAKELGKPLVEERKLTTLLVDCRHHPPWLSSRDDSRAARCRDEIVPIIRASLPEQDR